jgi:hypothetical protein
VRDVQMGLWMIQADGGDELAKAFAIIKAMQPG